MLSFIDVVGVDYTIISSDLGQKNNPFPEGSLQPNSREGGVIRGLRGCLSLHPDNLTYGSLPA